LPEGIKRRDALLAKCMVSRDSRGIYGEYCKVRNRVQRDIKKAKVEQDKGDPGKLWAHLGSLGHKSKSSSGAGIVLETEGDRCFEASGVASRFNYFFTSVASQLFTETSSPF
jgi:hypothetical protein